MPETCNEQSAVSFGSRIFSIVFSVVFNIIGATFLYYKLYKENVKGMKHKRFEKMDPFVIHGTFFYILLGTIACLYNLLYRFIIEHTKQACLASDIIDEYLIVFARAYLLLFFTYRVEAVFKNSSYAFDSKKMLVFRIFVVLEFLIVNTVWIAILDMKICAIHKPEEYGLYCKNSGNIETIITHFTFESIFYIMLLYLFVRQLTLVTKSLEEPLSVNNNMSKSKKYRLLKVAIRQTVFVTISIISTWILYLASVIDTNGPYKVLRWFYPLDWTINVWCIILMFKFVDFNRICSICECCSDVYKICPCLPEIWKEALAHYSDERKNTSMHDMGSPTNSSKSRNSGISKTKSGSSGSSKNSRNSRNSKNKNNNDIDGGGKSPKSDYTASPNQSASSVMIGLTNTGGNSVNSGKSSANTSANTSTNVSANATPNLSPNLSNLKVKAAHIPNYSESDFAQIGNVAINEGDIIIDSNNDNQLQTINSKENSKEKDKEKESANELIEIDENYKQNDETEIANNNVNDDIKAKEFTENENKSEMEIDNNE